jgi:coatomer protein complex subunit alpha (xenin)
MLPEDGVPELPAHSTLLVPPAPLLKEENWPLLTISKGFFETLAAKGAAAAAAGGAGAAAAAAAAAGGAGGAAAMELDENELEGAGWGDELDLGGDEAAEPGLEGGWRAGGGSVEGCWRVDEDPMCCTVRPGRLVAQ